MFNIISSSVEQQDWADGLWYRVPLNLCTCFRSVCHPFIHALKKSLASSNHTWCKRGLKPSISFHFFVNECAWWVQCCWWQGAMITVYNQLCWHLCCRVGSAYLQINLLCVDLNPRALSNCCSTRRACIFRTDTNLEAMPASETTPLCERPWPSMTESESPFPVTSLLFVVLPFLLLLSVKTGFFAVNFL